jgi:homoserine dehydrogenase
VVADLVDVTRALTADPQHRVPHLAFQPESLSNVSILPMERVETAYYLRITALDRPGVLADITRILAGSGISIEAIRQREPAEGEQHVPIILLTQRVREQAVNEALRQIEALESVKGKVTRLRLETLA